MSNMNLFLQKKVAEKQMFMLGMFHLSHINITHILTDFFSMYEKF